LAAVRSYYDGKFLYATVGAKYDWLMRKCHTSNDKTIGRGTIQNKRLFSMKWKGFELSPMAENYLAACGGWNDLKKERYENSFPCLSRDIPLKIQDANFYTSFRLVWTGDNFKTLEC